MEIKRENTKNLFADLKEPYISILIGARQVGKTFLLKKIQARAQSMGLKTAFFDLEQPNISNQFNKTDEELVELIINSGDVIFIDEFHYLQNASHIFKAIYDQGTKVKIFASGSSSFAIHKHLKESLAGRKSLYKIFPCSLTELSQVIKKDPLEHYCLYGGLPGLIHVEGKEKKQKLLVDILQSYILKDIKSLVKEENITAFNNLLYLLAQQQGSVVTTAKLAKEVGLTAKTIEAYLEILAQTYVNFPIYSFSLNFGNELKKSKKYYLYDLGIRNTLLKNFSPLKERKDAGAIIESYVFLQLNQKQTPETALRFWRLKDGAEVDFIWVKNQKPYPIEVKTSCKKGEIPKGITAFLKRYPETEKAYIVNKNITDELKYNKTTIFFKRWQEAASIPSEI